MFKSYCKTAIRFLLKNKTFSFINIFGLAIGTLCCLYIVLYVQDQHSYDLHQKDAKDIYRVTSLLKLTGDKINMATCSPPIAAAMKNDFAEIKQYTRIIPLLGVSQNVIRYKEKAIYEKRALLVDSTFFELFTYQFINGRSANALSQPNTIILLKSVADKLFGTDDPIGKTIQIDNDWGKNDLTVTGVVDESLGKYHIQANLFINLNGYSNDLRDNHTWSGNNFTYTYVKLQSSANAAALEKKLPAFLEKYAGQELKSRGMEKHLLLQPIHAIHTSTGYGAETGKTVSNSFLYILLLIAVLIQVIACINFMNLSTARASKRAKEVGVRKVIGAGRKRLVLQFLSESFLLSLLGMAIALVLLRLTLPLLNTITHAEIGYFPLASYRIWALVTGIVLVTGLLAGSYPAFYLSAFDAIKVLKGNFTNHVSAAGIRRSLVVFQFVLSIVLIAVIVVIYSQLNYIKNKDLGFDKNQKLLFTFINAEARNKMQPFINGLQQLPEIKTVTRTNNFPGKELYHNWGVFLAGGNLATSVNQSNIAADEHFLHATGIQLISGRDFRAQDSGKVLINEALAKKLGLTARTALSTRLFTEDANRVHEIVGVMKDFNFRSLHDNVSPFMLIYARSADLSNLIVNISSTDYRASLGKIEGIWHQTLPGVPFDYAFMDEAVQKQYETEITLSNVINCFTFIAIFISCLGLFGLAAFSAEQRSKEIGIRKVLGASVTGVVRLLSTDFVKLVAIAIIIATPIAWWVMNRWLEAFAYRITISWWMFALAGSLALLIALITVSSQAIRAATANPMKSLKSE